MSAKAAVLLAVMLTLSAAATASAGQIVYTHGGDLWVMNDDGADQRALLTQAQAGATSLSQPNLFPATGALTFQGSVNAPDGSCVTECIGISTLIGGSVHRVTPAAINCRPSPGISCVSRIDNTPTLTADGRVLYLQTSAVVTYSCYGFYCYGSANGGNEYEIQSASGGDQPNQWPDGTSPVQWFEPAGTGGVDSSPAADPADPHLIAYPAWEDPADVSFSVNPLVVDDDAAQNPFVVSDDDVTQWGVTWSPDGAYVLDIESGSEPGIWAYTAQARGSAGWKAYYILATPPQTANGGGLGPQISITSDGRVLFSSAHVIYALPASCGPYGGASAPGGTATANCTLAQATQLTTSGGDDDPTWTAVTESLSYVPPGNGAGSGSGGAAGGSGGSGGTAGGGGPGSRPASTRPGTVLARRTISRRERRATFMFRATGPATGFECALVRAPARGHHKRHRPARPRYGRCRSPKRYSRLAHGRYTFLVRAVGTAGVDRTPVSARFTL